MILEALFAAIATFGFAMIFNVKRLEAISSGLAGGLSWGLYLYLKASCGSEALSFFCAALFSGLVSEVLAKVLKKPATLFVVPCMIPLVPGATLYRTMSFALLGQYDKAFHEGMTALLIAGSIATGIALSASLTRIYAKARIRRS